MPRREERRERKWEEWGGGGGSVTSFLLLLPRRAARVESLHVDHTLPSEGALAVVDRDEACDCSRSYSAERGEGGACFPADALLFPHPKGMQRCLARKKEKNVYMLYALYLLCQFNVCFLFFSACLQ